MDDFPTRLKFFRSFKNLSQTELANRAGISRKQISDYEVGIASNPRKSTFKKILDALGVTETEFLNSDCLFESSDLYKQSGTPMDDFPKKLKFFRSSKDLSQAELARRVGISSKQVSDYEVGTSIPRLSTFKKILDALGVTEIEFLNSDCLFESNDPYKQSGTPLAMILTSPSRGKLINITGMELSAPYRSEININIYSGTITRTKQADENYINVYYLTSEKEECIFVHKENIEPILACMKNSH